MSLTHYEWGMGEKGAWKRSAERCASDASHRTPDRRRDGQVAKLCHGVIAPKATTKMRAEAVRHLHLKL